MDNTLSHPRPVLLGTALIVLAATGFSSKSILIKLAYADAAGIDAITLMTLRMVFALPFFLLVALWRPDAAERKPARADWAAVFVLGILGYYLASLLDFSGLEYISASLERLILFLYPTLVVLLTAVLYRRRVTTAQWIALLLSYAGIALVFADGAADQEMPRLWLGALLVFASAVVFAIFMTGSGHVIPRLGSRRFTAWSMSVACLATIAHFLASHSLEQLLVSRRVLVLGLLLALFSTVLPAFAMNAGIRRVGAARAAIVSAAGPIATLVMAWSILGEALSATQLAGAALVLGGVLVISLQKTS